MEHVPFQYTFLVARRGTIVEGEPVALRRASVKYGRRLQMSEIVEYDSRGNG